MVSDELNDYSVVHHAVTVILPRAAELIILMSGGVAGNVVSASDLRRALIDEFGCSDDVVDEVFEYLSGPVFSDYFGVIECTK